MAVYTDVSDEEIYDVARLVVAAEIAKIHTIEWTTQLLYDEPLDEFGQAEQAYEELMAAGRAFIATL